MLSKIGAIFLASCLAAAWSSDMPLAPKSLARILCRIGFQLIKVWSSWVYFRNLDNYQYGFWGSFL